MKDRDFIWMLVMVVPLALLINGVLLAWLLNWQ